MLKQLNDITECCICMKTYTDPRILPCVHTFCLKCLRKLSSHSEHTSQEEMPCPVCRTMFTIPKTGFSGLQKNFFMAKLVEMTNTSRQTGNNSQKETGDSVESIRNCLRCKDGSCSDCEKQKPSTIQELAAACGAVEDESTDEDEDEHEVTRRMSEVEMKCDQHTTMSLEVYCHDCQRIICYKCLVEDQHKGHRGSAVESVANDFRREIQSNLEKVSNYRTLCDALMRETEKQRKTVVAEFDEKERAVLERSKDLKELVERHTKDLLDELLSAKKERLKVMEMEKEETERLHTILESSEVYSSDVKTKGSATDVCRVKDEMNRRTNELGEILSRIEISSVEVSFQERNLEKSLAAGDNVVGKIKSKLFQFQDICRVLQNNEL